MKKLFLAIIVIMPLIVWLGPDIYNKRTAHERYMSAASLFTQKKDLSKALELIDQAIKLNPQENHSYLYKKAEIFHYLSEYDQALACLDELTKISSHYVDAYKFKAEIFDEIGKSDEAILIYDEAIKNNPGNQDILKYKNEFLARRNNVDLDAD